MDKHPYSSWRQRQAIKAKLQRVIVGLKFVEACKPPPFSTGAKKLKGSAAKGIAYEKKVNKALKKWVEEGAIEGELWLGPWIRFEDENGIGLAQPDAVVRQTDRVLIFESKLKQTKSAIPQLKMYGDLLEPLMKVPPVYIQCFKFPSYSRDLLWLELPNLDIIEPYEHYCVHFLG